MRRIQTTLSYHRLLQRFPDLQIVQLRVFFADSFALLGPAEVLESQSSRHMFMSPDEPISFFQLLARRKGQDELFYFALRDGVATLALVDVSFREIDAAPVCARFCRIPALPESTYLAVCEDGTTMCYRCESALELHLCAATVSFSLVLIEPDLYVVQSAVLQTVSGLYNVKSKGAVYYLELVLPDSYNNAAYHRGDECDCLENKLPAETANYLPKALRTQELIFTVFSNERIPGVQVQLAKCEAGFTSYAVLQLSYALDDLLVLGSRPFSLYEVFNQSDADCLIQVFTNANQERLVRVYSDATGSAQSEEFLEKGVVYYARTLSTALEFTVSRYAIYSALAQMRPVIQIAPGWRLWINDNQYSRQQRIKNDLVRAAICKAEMKAHAYFIKTLSERTVSLYKDHAADRFAKFKSHAAARILSIKQHYLQVYRVEDSIQYAKARTRELEDEKAKLAKTAAALQARMNDTERQRMGYLRALRFVPPAGPEQQMSLMDPQRQRIADSHHEKQFYHIRDDAQRKNTFNYHLRYQQREQLEERLKDMRNAAHAGTEQLSAQRKYVQEQYESVLRRRSEKPKGCEAAQAQKSLKPPELGVKASLMGQK